MRGVPINEPAQPRHVRCRLWHLPVIVLFVVFLVLGLPGEGPPANDAAVAAQDDPPNIVFIMTDDMAKTDLKHMPKTKKLLVDQGTTFDNAFVTYSLCCPARATFLRGQYAHNHRVLTNAIYDRGGEPRFRELGSDKSTVATWLNDAGYRTAHVGKYMNGYDSTYVPPGWDEWYTLVGRFHVNQRLNENGEIKNYDKSSVDDVLKQKAAQFLSRNAGNEPFYLQVSTHAPHGPTSYPPRHADKFAGAKPPGIHHSTKKTFRTSQAGFARRSGWIKRINARSRTLTATG